MTPSDISSAPSTTTVRARVDHRPGQRAAALSLAAGGVLFAVGNALHPLDHSDAATRAPTWAAAHLVFALGALLMAGALAALGRRLAPSRVGVAGLVLTAVGLVLVVGSAYVEVYVAPVVGHHTIAEIDATAGLWMTLTLLTYVVGPMLVAVAGLRHRAFPVAVCAGILLAQAATLALPAVPVAEGYVIIPATVVFGLAFAVAGWLARNDAPVR